MPGIDQLIERDEQSLDVCQVQAGRRLVEDVQSVFGALQLAELGCDLDSLRFAARQRRRRLSQRQIAKAEAIQHVDLPRQRRFGCEKGHALLDRHVQHVVDRLAADGDLERFGVESSALAGAARHLDVRHEVQLGRDDPLALTLFAPAAFDVEAESPGFVVALDRQRRVGKEVADGVVEADVSCRIRPAVSSDRRLIDADHLVHVLDAVDAIVLARQRAGVFELLPERLVENVVDERALAGSRGAGDCHQLAERDGHVDALQVVLARATHDD